MGMIEGSYVITVGRSVVEVALKHEDGSVLATGSGKTLLEAMKGLARELQAWLT